MELKFFKIPVCVGDVELALLPDVKKNTTPITV